jgi:hypothetical protein
VRHFIERGYVVFIIDYPANPSNLDSPYAFNDIRPVAMWPDAVFWCARAIQAIKDNKDSTTPLGLKLLGSGNSIDPNYGIWWGNSWGGTIGLMLAWMPDWMVERYSTPALRRAGDRPKSSHRLKVWTAFEPQLDLTQFDIEPLSLSAKPTYIDDAGLGAIYMDDKAQWLMRKDSLDKWSTTALEDKKISPWWMLQAGYPENADVLICVRWPASPALSIPEEANLTPDDFDPGTVPTQADRDAGKAQRDPHHPFQARALQTELASYGNESSLCRKSIIRWGSGTTGTWANPGGAFIGQSGFAELVYNAAVTHAGYPEA